METTTVGKALREQINRFMGGFPIPEGTPAGAAPVQREDGVQEFYKHWRVRGNDGINDGLYATFADNDDLIEFGLSDRQGSEVVNVLQATLTLDEDHGELTVSSDTKIELNFNTIVTPEKTAALTVAMMYFGEVFSGRESAQ